jgi:hypothetical protein
MTDPFAYEFLRALNVLKEYLQKVVLIGGSAAFVYSRYMFEAPFGQAPIYTHDLDLLVENELPLSEHSVAYLMERAGFAGRCLESQHTQYFKFQSRLGTGFEVEFLTTAPGRQHGDTMVVQGGIRAQILDGLESLLANNIEVRISDCIGDVSCDLTVSVPTPGAFVLNKIQSYLDPIGDVSRTKDMYYVFYVVRHLPTGKQAIVDDMKKCLTKFPLEDLASRLEPLFADENSRGSRELATQLYGLDITENQKRLLAHLEIAELITLMKYA